MQFGDINFFRQSQGVQQNNRSEVAFPTKITAQGQFYLCAFECVATKQTRFGLSN